MLVKRRDNGVTLLQKEKKTIFIEKACPGTDLLEGTLCTRVHYRYWVKAWNVEYMLKSVATCTESVNFNINSLLNYDILTIKQLEFSGVRLLKG